MTAIEIKAFRYAPQGKSSASEVPEGYVCGSCKKSGCKLWRDYQTFLDHQTLECVDCAGKSQGKDVSDAREDGTVSLTYSGGGVEYTNSSDQIGWRVPAVPTEDGSTFWGYSSVPEAGVQWWKRLPTRVF